MTLDAMPGDRQLALALVDEKADHVRGSPAGRLILEYGDYECPYSRQAFHAIELVEQQLGGNVRFAFRHFPLTGIHPHALAAAAAAEAAAAQGRFWDMHELLFHRQKALEDGDLRGYAAQLGLDVAAFDTDRASTAVADRIRRDVDSGLASGQVLGTPTLFIDGVVTAAATTRPHCWRRWRHQGDQKQRRWFWAPIHSRPAHVLSTSESSGSGDDPSHAQGKAWVRREGLHSR
jgi:protein-disulfide isomerase